jgi:hypothetical protein
MWWLPGIEDVLKDVKYFIHTCDGFPYYKCMLLMRVHSPHYKCHLNLKSNWGFNMAMQKK